MIERAKNNFRFPTQQRNLKKILLLDDEPFNIEALKFIFKTIQLENFPESIICSYDAEEALKIIK